MRCIWILALALTATSGCFFAPDVTPPIIEDTYYLPHTSPANVLHNLQVSYRRREIHEYAKLFHPEFIFRFQQTDVQDVGTDFWTRDQDTTQTKNLFDAINVTRISIDLTYQEEATPITPGSDTLTIRVTSTFLEVDELVEGILTTWRVSGDIQDFFFVRSESDATIWQIIEWRDIPGGGALARDPVSLSADRAAEGVRAATWGALRAGAENRPRSALP